MNAFRGIVESLTGIIRSLSWEPEGTEWGDYYAKADHYSEAALAEKQQLVEAFVQKVRPTSVWDIGANTGMFSRIAARHSVHTVAFDIDPAAVEAHYRALKKAESNENILPLVLDLANPSPAIGWSNSEREAIGERGPVDLVLALALVHHLAIGNNVPLPLVAKEFARLCRYLLIEFVPHDDPKVSFMLSSREDIFGGYSEEAFRRAFESFFEISAREKLGDSGRTLYLMEARDKRAQDPEA
jgi:ribosomal protein L11 methylase PrmA